MVMQGLGCRRLQRVGRSCATWVFVLCFSFGFGAYPHIYTTGCNHACYVPSSPNCSLESGLRAHQQELESMSLSKDANLSRRLCLTILRAADTSVEGLQACVWQPCLDLVAERLGKEVASRLQHMIPVILPACSLRLAHVVVRVLMCLQCHISVQCHKTVYVCNAIS